MVYIAFDPIYKHPLPEGHRFPMEKYELIPQQLMHEGLAGKENFFSPGTLTREEILQTHTTEYWESLTRLDLSDSEIRKIGFPLSEQLIRREVCIAKGTLEGSYFSLEHGIAYNVAGGTHHSFTYKGEGFCILNDQALAANILLNRGLVKKVLFVDLDVHQGNGTAEIFKQDNRVFTFSMHGAGNYPFHKEKSDLDIGLPDQIGDEAYMQLLNFHLDILLEREKPDFIFYQAGVDILATDKLGRLKISREGCQNRDRKVISEAWKRKIPIMVSMGGGYSPNIRDILEAHINTFRVGLDYFG